MEKIEPKIYTIGEALRELMVYETNENPLETEVVK